ncbi:hypothetical protein ElyMa_005978900 [Elysia marginata]|uniref:Uncharacterized protein n=1 Tax=Elysia marginata TaxID=1093978 RepID=A0AAV4GE86_9GAST|nr:hypothetical protein ElyMa_005978900 [Elysia marginata]
MVNQRYEQDATSDVAVGGDPNESQVAKCLDLPGVLAIPVILMRVRVLHTGLLWPYAVTLAVSRITLTVLWSLAGALRPPLHQSFTGHKS